MVEARNFGSEGFVVNHIDAGEYGGGSDLLAAALKAKRGGVGGRGSKAHNHKEAKVANRRRNEKREREENKADEVARAKWMAEETKKWQPVDKADLRHAQKMQGKSNKQAAKAAKAAQKAADNEDY